MEMYGVSMYGDVWGQYVCRCMGSVCMEMYGVSMYGGDVWGQYVWRCMGSVCMEMYGVSMYGDVWGQYVWRCMGSVCMEMYGVSMYGDVWGQYVWRCMGSVCMETTFEIWGGLVQGWIQNFGARGGGNDRQRRSGAGPAYYPARGYGGASPIGVWGSAPAALHFSSLKT